MVALFGYEIKLIVKTNKTKKMKISLHLEVHDLKAEMEKASTDWPIQEKGIDIVDEERNWEYCMLSCIITHQCIFDQMEPERYGSTYPGHKFPMRD